jgi:uncharacterized membrane protein YobD (UPF0266 family)
MKIVFIYLFFIKISKIFLIDSGVKFAMLFLICSIGGKSAALFLFSEG